MNKTKVIVVVEGGLVTEVFTSSPVDLEVIDFDTQTIEDADRAERDYDAAMTLLNDGKITPIF